MALEHEQHCTICALSYKYIPWFISRGRELASSFSPTRMELHAQAQRCLQSMVAVTPFFSLSFKKKEGPRVHSAKNKHGKKKKLRGEKRKKKQLQKGKKRRKRNWGEKKRKKGTTNSKKEKEEEEEAHTHRVNKKPTHSWGKNTSSREIYEDNKLCDRLPFTYESISIVCCVIEILYVA